MKLNHNLIIQDVDGVQFLVPIGEDAFKGIVRSNETAAFIVTLLKEETTEATIVDALCKKYNVGRAEAAADTEEFLNALRRLRVLDE